MLLVFWNVADLFPMLDGILIHFGRPAQAFVG